DGDVDVLQRLPVLPSRLRHGDRSRDHSGGGRSRHPLRTLADQGGLMTVLLAGPSAPAWSWGLGSRPSLVAPVAAQFAAPPAWRVMGLWLPPFPRRSSRFAP